MNGALVARVHELCQARAVLDLTRSRGAEATLVTAPGSAGFAGVGFWRAVERELGHPVVIDCGDDAGLAMAALREGSRDLLFTGAEAIAAKLASMAGQLGGRVRRELDGPVLELLAEEDPARRLAGLGWPSPLEADGGAT